MAHLRLAADWPRHPFPRLLLVTLGLGYLLHPGHTAKAVPLPPWSRPWVHLLSPRTHRVRSPLRAPSVRRPSLIVPPAYPTPGAATSPPPALSTLGSQATFWLAKIVQAEAGNQPFISQLAVAAVVLNRTQSGLFPRQILSTILQPGQFQPVSNGTFASTVPSPSAWTAARTILQGGPNPAPSALYFFNPAVTTIPWMFQLIDCVTYGALRFCAGPPSSAG